MQTQQDYGKAAIFEIMRRLGDAIQANGGFREPTAGPDPYARIPERFRDASFENFETGVTLISARFLTSSGNRLRGGICCGGRAAGPGKRI
jgi:hypothetical protein